MIANRNKANGTAREHKAKKLLETDGYKVIRVAGSHGVADLIAIKPGQLLFVQVKSAEYLPPGEWNALYQEAEDCGAIPIHCAVLFRKIVWRRLIAPKTVQTHNPPWEAWTTDQVATP